MTDFTTALLRAEKQFNARLHHPLRDTQINDVPVIAAELMCGVAKEKDAEIERLRAALRSLVRGVEADAKGQKYDPYNVVDAHTWLALAMKEAELEVVGAVDLAHAPAPEQGDNTVAS